MKRERTAVVGLGSRLRGDDGVGVEVLRLLRDGDSPQAELVDVGSSPIALLDVMETYDRVVVVDCTRMGTAPGSVRAFSPRDVESRSRTQEIGIHDADPLAVFDLGRALGFEPDLVLVGIEPHNLEQGAELSDVVRGALPQAVEMVEEVLARWKEKEDGSKAAHSHRRG